MKWFYEAAKAIRKEPTERWEDYVERVWAEAVKLSAPRTPYREPGDSETEEL